MILESAIGERAKTRAREDFNSMEKIPRRNYNEEKNSCVIDTDYISTI